jgi:hypothetical protein
MHHQHCLPTLTYSIFIFLYAHNHIHTQQVLHAPSALPTDSNKIDSQPSKRHLDRGRDSHNQGTTFNLPNSSEMTSSSAREDHTTVVDAAASNRHSGVASNLKLSEKGSRLRPIAQTRQLPDVDDAGYMDASSCDKGSPTPAACCSASSPQRLPFRESAGDGASSLPYVSASTLSYDALSPGPAGRDSSLTPGLESTGGSFSGLDNRRSPQHARHGTGHAYGESIRMSSESRRSSGKVSHDRDRVFDSHGKYAHETGNCVGDETLSHASGNDEVDEYDSGGECQDMRKGEGESNQQDSESDARSTGHVDVDDDDDEYNDGEASEHAYSQYRQTGHEAPRSGQACDAEKDIFRADILDVSAQRGMDDSCDEFDEYDENGSNRQDDVGTRGFEDGQVRVHIQMTIYVCMFVCVCVCSYIYIYIYIYTHTHTHTNAMRL